VCGKIIGFPNVRSGVWLAKALLSLHVFQEFIPVDVCLFENGKQGACGNLMMVGNRDKPPAFRVQEMDMTAGLPDRFEPKKSENFYDLKS
jgi:hypothetical protein